VADKRLFFALWPSPRQREILRDTIGPALSTVEGNPVNRRNWHITLVYIGDFPESRIPDLQAAAGTIDPGEIRVRFDTLSFWQRPKIAAMLMRRVPPQLEQLVTSLQKTLIPFGYAPDPRAYRPHITVARKVRAFQEIPLARPIELTWTEFALVESASLRGENQYHPLKQ
jgi:2'-5' RNA ligase